MSAPFTEVPASSTPKEQEEEDEEKYAEGSDFYWQLCGGIALAANGFDWVRNDVDGYLTFDLYVGGWEFQIVPTWNEDEKTFDAWEVRYTDPEGGQQEIETESSSARAQESAEEKILDAIYQMVYDAFTHRNEGIEALIAFHNRQPKQEEEEG